MTDERFRRVGLDYRFAPREVPLVLQFQNVKDPGDKVECQILVQTAQEATVVTRHVNLMAGPTRGALADLIKELHEMNGHGISLETWRALMREAAESVIHSHRKGRPFEVIEGVIERPPPPRWLCHGLLLKNKPNCWLGAASTGKSTLAKAMCAYYASGFRFCERPMEQGVPLYLDWEDDRDSFERVVYDVCRNLGLQGLPRMLWRDMHGFRLRDQLRTIASMVDRERVGLIVLDAVAAAGGSAGEHTSWESIALEMEECLGALPAVTILALDHVTGAEHRAQRNGNGSKPPVPIKARGAERKLEYLRNQWTLVADVDAEHEGRHVVEWTHTKCNVAAKEPYPFATEIVHRDSEMSIVLREIETAESRAEVTQAQQLLAELATTSGRTARELALQFDGHEPSQVRIRSVRKMLDRAVLQGHANRLPGQPVRYRTTGRQPTPEGTLLAFPGGAN